MKALKGTEKQIAWAEQIRKDYMEALNQYKELSEKPQRSGEENDRLSGLEFRILRRSVNELQNEIEKELYFTMKDRRSMTREDKKAKRAEVKENLQARKDEIIAHTLDQDEASYWIDYVRVS